MESTRISKRAPGLAARTMAAVLLVSGCAAADAGLSNDVVTFTDPPVSVPVVELDAATLAAAPALSLEEMFRIDGESNPGGRFTYIRGMDFTGDGSLAFTESQLAAVFIYDTTGTLVRRLGGKGGGPGEFMQPRQMTVAADTMYVVDGMAIHRFTADGDYIDRFRIDNARTVDGATSMAAAQMIAQTPGGLVGYFITGDYRDRGTPGEADRDTMIVQRIEAVTGAVSAPIIHVERDVFKSDFMVSPGWFVPEPQIAVGQDGRIHVTRTSGASIDMFDFEGRLTQRIVFSPDRRKVTDADIQPVRARRDSLLARLSEDVPDGHGDRKELTTQKAAFEQELPRAALYPVIGRIIADAEGDLLVERADLSAGSREWPAAGPTVWDLLNPDGSVTGRVEFPVRFQPMTMSGRMVAGIAIDDDDVPSVIAYRLR